MITPTIKDSVLKWLCDNMPVEQYRPVNLQSLFKETNLTFDTIEPILQYFNRLGLIGELNARRTSTLLLLRIEAHDFLSRGGFIAQEEIFKKEIEKLIIEIENFKKQLKPDQLETAEKLSTIASAILSGITLFVK
ncbi:hypothetical protein [Runella zeae]|uniref:hypothetical protein n=1 Tax=Runella zeae TaxID=94255 RepID=UPI002352F4DA|nr:hypothetical protein [Runella zeae]